MKKILKLFASLFIVITAFTAAMVPVYAEEPYTSYNYDSWGEVETVPSGYSCTYIIGDSEIILKEPTDIYYTEGKLYVLDSGNSRIAVFDKKYNYIKSITNFYYFEDGKKTEYTLNGASGIFVSQNGRIAVADTGNAKVIICTEEGEIVSQLSKPENDSFPSELTFAPVRVAIDDMDNTYVLSNGFYYGAIVYNVQGVCTGFFGSNKVKVSASLLVDMFWRKFMNKKQLEYTKSYVPVAFSSMDIDKNNFIYTCTADTEKAIRKLNYLGEDIFEVEQGPDPLDKSIYGDRQTQLYDGNFYYTALCDIAVSDNDFVYALDSTKGRVFEYDQNSNLLNVFGAKGEQKGTFSNPVAIETVDDSVLVLDEEKALIYVFSPTEYGNLLHNATTLYNHGKFTEAENTWNEVLKYNTNSELVYRSIGRSKLQQEDYRAAMHYAELGQDRSGYSKAFRLYRSEMARKYFVVFVILIILILAAFFAVKLIKSKRGKNRIKEKKINISVKNVIFHPLLLYENLYNDKGKYSLVVSGVIITFFFIGQVLKELATGFIFNQNNITQFNAFFILFQSVGIVLICTLSDIVVGSLRFGHGTVRRVFTGVSVAFVPYTITLYINVLLSQVLTYEEATIMNIISTIGLLYTIFLLYQSIRIMQQYTVKETCISIILDVLVAVAVLLLMIIIFMLVRQVYIFGATVLNELLYRMN